MKRLLAMCVVLLVAAAFAQEAAEAPSKAAKMGSKTGSASFRGTVQKMADEWREAFKAKDADKIAAMYTDDAVWINAEGSFHGSADIKNELKKMIDRGDTVSSIVCTKAQRAGDLGYSEGTYSGKAPSASGQEQPSHGDWVVTIKNLNEKWLIAAHTSLPPVAAAGKAMKKHE